MGALKSSSSPSGRIRVFLVEDQTIVRQGLKSLLAYAGDLEVAGEAADGEAAIEAVAKAAPDVMLAGFHAMDEHFRTAPLEENLPVLMALLTVWYADFFAVTSVAVLPYDQYMSPPLR